MTIFLSTIGLIVIFNCFIDFTLTARNSEENSVSNSTAAEVTETTTIFESSTFSPSDFYFVGLNETTLATWEDSSHHANNHSINSSLPSNFTVKFTVNDLQTESSFINYRQEPNPWIKHENFVENSGRHYSNDQSNTDEYDEVKPKRMEYKRPSSSHYHHHHHQHEQASPSSNKSPQALRHEYNHQQARNHEPHFKYSGAARSTGMTRDDHRNAGRAATNDQAGSGGSTREPESGPVVRHEWTTDPVDGNEDSSGGMPPVPKQYRHSSGSSSAYQEQDDSWWSRDQNSRDSGEDKDDQSSSSSPGHPDDEPLMHHQYEEEASEDDNDDEDDGGSEETPGEGSPHEIIPLNEKPLSAVHHPSQPPLPSGPSLTRYGGSGNDLYQKYRKAKDLVAELIPTLDKDSSSIDRPSKREYSVKTKYKKGKKYTKKMKKMKSKKKKKKMKKCKKKKKCKKEKKKKCKKVKKCKPKKKKCKPKKKKCEYESWGGDEWGGWGGEVDMSYLFKKPKKIKFKIPESWDSWGGFDSYGTYEGKGGEKEFTLPVKEIFAPEFISEHHEGLWAPIESHKPSKHKETEEEDEEEEDEEKDDEKQEPYSVRVDPNHGGGGGGGLGGNRGTMSEQPFHGRLEPQTKYDADRPYEVHEADMYPPKFEGDSMNFQAPGILNVPGIDPMGGPPRFDPRGIGFAGVMPFSGKEGHQSSSSGSHPPLGNSGPQSGHSSKSDSPGHNNKQAYQATGVIPSGKWKKRPPPIPSSSSQSHAEPPHSGNGEPSPPQPPLSSPQSGHQRTRDDDEPPIDWNRHPDWHKHPQPHQESIGDREGGTGSGGGGGGWRSEYHHHNVNHNQRDDWKSSSKQQLAPTSNRQPPSDEDQSWQDREKECNNGRPCRSRD